jgi:prepilin-type N-terminal cleavage/methylation domain-containing protein
MRGPDRRRPRAGFTLIEVMVALAISGMVLLAARSVLSQLGADARRIEAAAAESDRVSNADRLLRDVVGRTENSSPDGPRFVGDARAARFATWCEVPAGWLERCDATLGIVQAGDALSLVLTLSDGELVPLRTGLRRARLKYLVDGGEGGHWTGEWTSRLSTPAAVGVEVDDSTLIVPLGERG